MSERTTPAEPTQRTQAADQHRTAGAAEGRARVVERWLALVPVLCLAAWFWVAMHPLFLGPADWDDTMYTDRAISGAFVWDVRNRYVHVWAMRVLDLLLPTTHRTAAAVWAALCVCGLGGLAYWSAQRIAGRLCGLLALVLTLCFPPMLKYLSVPHVDFSMALFGLLGVLAATLAVETRHVRVARIAACVSGVCGFLALKSKETALVVPPLSVYLLSGLPPRQRVSTYLVWALGLALGFSMLLALDRSVAAPKPGAPARGSDLGVYFTPQPPDVAEHAARTAPDAAVRRNLTRDGELLDLLGAPSFAAFTLLGLAGFARAAHKNVWVRALGLWALSVLVFTVVVSVFSQGIDAQDRYVIALGPALGPLAAYWLVSLVREPRREAFSWFFLSLLVATTVLGVWGLWAVYRGDATAAQSRAASLATPLALLLGFLTAWAAPRFTAAGAAICTLAISIGIASHEASRYRAQKRHELEPWLSLAERLDATEPGALPHIAVFNGRSYRAARLRWRLHVLSKRERIELAVRDIERVEQLEPAEWVFVGATSNDALQARHYVRILALESDPRPWALYQPPAPGAAP